MHCCWYQQTFYKYNYIKIFQKVVPMMWIIIRVSKSPTSLKWIIISVQHSNNSESPGQNYKERKVKLSQHFQYLNVPLPNHGAPCLYARCRHGHFAYCGHTAYKCVACLHGASSPVRKTAGKQIITRIKVQSVITVIQQGNKEREYFLVEVKDKMSRINWSICKPLFQAAKAYQ